MIIAVEHKPAENHRPCQFLHISRESGYYLHVQLGHSEYYFHSDMNTLDFLGMQKSFRNARGHYSHFYRFINNLFKSGYWTWFGLLKLFNVSNF